MKKRSKYTIIKEILKICHGEGATKTRVVYQANLNFRTVGPYLESLTNNNLLEKIDSKYKTTPNGEKMLVEMKAVGEFLPLGQLLANELASLRLRRKSCRVRVADSSC
jgi:predicted transcriptional regulator